VCTRGDREHDRCERGASTDHRDWVLATSPRDTSMIFITTRNVGALPQRNSALAKPFSPSDHDSRLHARFSWADIR
jgi:hypothetical protein